MVEVAPAPDKPTAFDWRPYLDPSKDEFFRDGHGSPLTEAQKAAFVGLRYYPENPALRLRGWLDRNVEHAAIETVADVGDQQ